MQRKTQFSKNHHTINIIAGLVVFYTIIGLSIYAYLHPQKSGLNSSPYSQLQENQAKTKHRLPSDPPLLTPTPKGQSKYMHRLSQYCSAFSPPKLPKTKLHDFNIASSINTLTLAKNAQNHVYACSNLAFVKAKHEKPNLIKLKTKSDSGLANSTQHLNAYANYSFLVPRKIGYAKPPHFRFGIGGDYGWIAYKFRKHTYSFRTVLTAQNSPQFVKYIVPDNEKIPIAKIYHENAVLPSLYAPQLYSKLVAISNNYFNAIANCDTRFWANDFANGFATSLLGQESSYRFNNGHAAMHVFNDSDKQCLEVADGETDDGSDPEEYRYPNKQGYFEPINNDSYKGLNDIDWRKHHYVRISQNRYLDNDTVYQLLALPYYWPKNDFTNFAVLKRGHTPIEQEIKVNDQYYYGDILCHYIPGQYIKQVNGQNVVTNKQGKLFYKKTNKPVATIKQSWWNNIIDKIRTKINK